MYSIEQIKGMTDEEIAAANKKLVRKIVLNRIVAPLAIVVVVHVVANAVVKKLEKNETED